MTRIRFARDVIVETRKMVPARNLAEITHPRLVGTLSLWGR